MTIPLPPVPQYVEESELREAFQDYGREAMRVALEAAMRLKADAMEIFNHDPAMTPQETRDVIEWYDASIRALDITPPPSPSPRS